MACVSGSKEAQGQAGRLSVGTFVLVGEGERTPAQGRQWKIGWNLTVDIDPEQIEFLMSQAIDGDISPADADRLDRYLAEVPEARAEFEKMKRLDTLVGQWGRQPAPMDDQRVGELLSESVRQDAEFAISRYFDGDEQAGEELAVHAKRDPNLGLLEHQYRRLEMIVRAWGEIEPPVDYDRLHDRLCATIRAEARRQATPLPRIFKLYVPLAAAASLLIVAGLWWTGRSAVPMPTGGPARIEVALAGPPMPSPDAKPVMEFTFGLADNAPVQTLAKASGSGSGIVISVGGFKASGPQANGVGEEMVF